MAKELEHDPDLALFSGADGLDLIRRFIPEAFEKLAPGGWLALEIGHDQAAEVSKLLEAAGIERFPAARKPS